MSPLPLRKPPLYTGHQIISTILKRDRKVVESKSGCTNIYIEEHCFPVSYYELHEWTSESDLHLTTLSPWDHLPKESPVTFLFHIEGDFFINLGHHYLRTIFQEEMFQKKCHMRKGCVAWIGLYIYRFYIWVILKEEKVRERMRENVGKK